MNKNYIIAAAGVIIVILIMVMASGGTTAPVQSSGQPDGQPTEGMMGPPIADKFDFKIYFAKYLQGDCPDPTVITATLKKNPAWVQEVLPQTFNLEFQSVKSRTYSILYPFMSPADIDRTKLLQVVVSVEETPRDTITLLKMGANINAPGVITSASAPEMLEYLLGHGADPNVPDEDGSYAYDLSRGESQKVRRLILEKHGGHGSGNDQ